MMKIKYLMIVALILTVMTLGAVCASDDIAAEDLTVEEPVEEVSLQDEEAVLGESEEDAVGYDDGDIECSIASQASLDGYTSVVSFSSYNSSITGNLSMYVDDNLRHSEIIETSDYNYYGSYSIVMTVYNLGITSAGTYKIDVKLNDNLIESGTLDVSDFPLEIEFQNLYDTQYIEYGDTVYFTFRLPVNSTGNLALTANGKTYDVNYKNGRGIIAVDTHGWNLGSNTFVVTYSGDDRYNATSFKQDIYIYPGVSYPMMYMMMGPNTIVLSQGEDESISFIAPSGTSGMVQAYVSSSSGYYLQNISISDGYGRLSLSNLTAGQYQIMIQGQVGNVSVPNNMLMVYVLNSSDFVSADLVANEIVVGNNAVVKVSGPFRAMANIILDDEFLKMVYIYDGQITEELSGLDVGTHKIKVVVILNTPDGSYSNTFYLTVKDKPVPDVIKMTLKKVKVKKSAKKLVLTSTLKINGKAVKGKIIKFKFNKKTYSAKTNYKGIAKVTIKKAVLKKLKAGKKLTYQASYGKTVKKLTVKVLK